MAMTIKMKTTLKKIVNVHLIDTDSILVGL